nr:hypothetical protein [Tanacetum cinerariifolium]
LLETCATLTKRVGTLEQDKIAQAIEITKLKQRVRRLEKKRKLKASGFKRLRKVSTIQRVKSLANTVIDDQEDVSKQGRKIAELDANEDITLETVDVQGRLPESQAQVYQLDLEHAQKVLRMQKNDEAEHAEVEEVIEVVTAAKLMTKVVITATATTAATTITAALVPKASALRRRGDEAFARELEAKLNANINWNEVIEQVKRKERQDNTVIRYQALKRKPITKAHARKSMMEIEEEESKRKSENLEQKAAKKQNINEETDELKTHLQILPNDEDDVYTEATPLALKVPIVDYQIHTEHNKPYYKIIRADETNQLFLRFISLLRNFDREDLEML